MNNEKLTYYVEIWCRDRDHEYSDRFCITTPDLSKVFAPHEDNDNMVKEVILKWNFGVCDRDEDTYTDDSYRDIWIDRLYELSQEEVNVMCNNEKKYLPNCDLTSEFAEKVESLYLGLVSKTKDELVKQ